MAIKDLQLAGADWLAWFSLAVALAAYLSTVRQRILDRIDDLRKSDLRGENGNVLSPEQIRFLKFDYSAKILIVIPAEALLILTCFFLLLERFSVIIDCDLTRIFATILGLSTFVGALTTLMVMHCSQWGLSYSKFSKKHRQIRAMAQSTKPFSDQANMALNKAPRAIWFWGIAVLTAFITAILLFRQN